MFKYKSRCEVLGCIEYGICNPFKIYTMKTGVYELFAIKLIVPRDYMKDIQISH